MYDRDSIDRQAESEAAAISTLAAYNDEPAPADPRVEIARLIERAAKLGLNRRPMPRYPRQRVTRWWQAVCEAYAAGGFPSAKLLCTAEPVSQDERERRKAKRVARIQRALSLGSLPARRKLSVAEAAIACGWSKRVLQRDIQNHILRAEKVYPAYGANNRKSVPGRGVFVVRAGDLRKYVKIKIAA